MGWGGKFVGIPQGQSPLIVQGSAELTWKIRCTETEDCNDDEWFLDGNLSFVAGRQILPLFHGAL